MGTAVACGNNGKGQCSIPPLHEGLTYTQVSAGSGHTVLLKSDGTAVACGDQRELQFSIPPLREGLMYTQVAAGDQHTVLLKSDGTVVSTNWFGGSLIASWYIATRPISRFEACRVLLATCEHHILCFVTLDGNIVCELESHAGEMLSDLRLRLMRQLNIVGNAFDVVFPGGERLSELLR